MRKDFDGSFYTDDYDQLMINFIKKKYSVVEDKVFKFIFDREMPYLRYINFEDAFVVCTTANGFIKGGVYLTKQQFKEVIGMKEIFTKGDLVVGKHVVEFRDGRRGLWLDKLILILEDDTCIPNGKILEGLKHTEVTELDIMKLYSFEENPCEVNEEDLIWIREENFEGIRSHCQVLEDELSRLSEKMNNIYSKLREKL